MFLLSQLPIFWNLPVLPKNTEIFLAILCGRGLWNWSHPFLCCENTVVSSGLRNNPSHKQFNRGFLSPPFPFNREPSSIVSRGDLRFPIKPHSWKPSSFSLFKCCQVLPMGGKNIIVSATLTLYPAPLEGLKSGPLSTVIPFQPLGESSRPLW